MSKPSLTALVITVFFASPAFAEEPNKTLLQISTEALFMAESMAEEASRLSQTVCFNADIFQRTDAALAMNAAGRAAKAALQLTVTSLNGMRSGAERDALLKRAKNIPISLSATNVAIRGKGCRPLK